jgi:hypothetical protein
MSLNQEWLRIWRERSFKNMTAHYRVSELYERRGRNVTKLNITFAIAVLFLANSRILDLWMASSYDGLFISCAGLGTVLTAAWQYINRYEERAAQHRLAASEYSALRREIDLVLHSQLPETQVAIIRAKADLLAKHTPLVEAKMWKRADQYVDEQRKVEQELAKRDTS